MLVFYFYYKVPLQPVFFLCYYCKMNQQLLIMIHNFLDDEWVGMCKCPGMFVGLYVTKEKFVWSYNKDCFFFQSISEEFFD